MLVRKIHRAAFVTLAWVVLLVGLNGHPPPAAAQGVSVRKDVHVFLDVSKTILNDAGRRTGLIEVVQKLLEAEDPETGARVITADDRVFIYQFADDVASYGDAGAPLGTAEIKQAMAEFAQQRVLPGIDKEFTRFDRLLSRLLEVSGIRESVPERVPVVIVASDFVHDPDNNPCRSLAAARQGVQSTPYGEQLSELRNLVGLDGDRGETVIFGHIFADWRPGEDMPFPGSGAANVKARNCWRDIMNEKVLLSELERPHFNAFSVSFRELESSPEPFLAALNRQLRRVARRLKLEGARIEERSDGLFLLAEAINDSEAPSKIFSLHFFSASQADRGAVELPSGGVEVPPGRSPIALPLPEQSGRSLIRESGLFVALRDLRTRGDALETLIRFEVGTEPFGALRILDASLERADTHYVVTTKVRNEGRGSNSVASAFVQPLDGPEHAAPQVGPGTAEIEPGSEATLSFAIPDAVLEALFATPTFQFGVNDEAEETDDPLVGVESPVRPPLEILPEREIVLGADGVMTISVRVRNSAHRDNAIRIARVLTGPEDPEGVAIELDVPVPGGDEAPLDLTFRGRDAERLSGQSLHLEVVDNRHQWEQEERPAQTVELGRVLRPPVELLRTPYTLEIDQDVRVGSQEDGDAGVGELILPVKVSGTGQGRVASVRLRSQTSPQIDIELPAPVLVTAQPRRLSIPLSRDAIGRLLASRGDIQVHFLSGPGARPALGSNQIVRIPPNDNVTFRSAGFELDDNGHAALDENAEMTLSLTVTNASPPVPIWPQSVLASDNPEPSGARTFEWAALPADARPLWLEDNQVDIALRFDLAARRQLMTGQSIFLWLLQHGQGLDQLGDPHEVSLPRKTPLEPVEERAPLNLEGDILSLDIRNPGEMPVTLEGLVLRGDGEESAAAPILEPERGPIRLDPGADDTVRFRLDPRYREYFNARLDGSFATLHAYLLDETEENSFPGTQAREIAIGLLDDRLTLGAVKPQRLVGQESDLIVAVDGEFVRQRRIDNLRVASRGYDEQDLEVRLLRGEEVLYSGSRLIPIDSETGAFRIVTRAARLDGQPEQYQLVVVSKTTDDKSREEPIVDSVVDEARIEPAFVISNLAGLILVILVLAIIPNPKDFARQVALSLAVQSRESLIYWLTGAFATAELAAGVVPHLAFDSLIPNYDLGAHLILLAVLAGGLILALASFVIPISNRVADARLARLLKRNDPSLLPLQIYQRRSHYICLGGAAGVVAVVMFVAHALLAPPDVSEAQEVLLLEPPENLANRL